ncbi:MAG: hypothetical protein WBM46_08710 [Polyangiales bacterium]
MEGVKVCLVDSDVCVLTDAVGSATSQAPVGQELSATFEKEGYASYVVPVVIPADPAVLTFGMATVERWEALHDLVMSPFPLEGTGDIVVVSTPGFAGATLDLGDATGKVYYYNEEGNWDADLPATTSYGWGGFTEVSPGEVQVDFGGTAEGCIPTVGWPGDVENSVRMPIRAGYITDVFVSCNVP